MKPRRAFIVVGTLTLLVSGLVYAIFVPGSEMAAHRVNFDAVRWKARSLDGDPAWPTRLRMADDLVASKTLDTLRREDVERLLGPGDQTDTWRDWDLAYQLGPQRSGSTRLESEWLVVRFDESGHVAAYRLIAD